MKKLLFLPFVMTCFTSLLTAQNINKKKLDNLLQKAQESNTEAIIVYQNNKLVTEQYYGIGHKDTLIEAMSSTKSIVGLAAVALLDDGLLDSLETPVYKYYPEWNQGKKKDITIKHLLNMTSGIQNHPNARKEIYPSSDFVQLALTAELTEKPGEKFRYNNKSLNLMAGVFEKITGKKMDLYIEERIFKPLSINNYHWSKDKAGNPHVMSGCQILPKDLAKIGLLLLNNGIYKGRQIITKKNIAKVITPAPQYAKYGLLWWLDYEGVKYTVDNEIIMNLKNLGVDAKFVAKVTQLKGNYASLPDFLSKLETVFGKNPWPYIKSNLTGINQLRKEEVIGNITAYRAEGYLGNYIYIDPINKVVAIRMISHKSYDHNDKTGKDGFRAFYSLIQSITK